MKQFNVDARALFLVAASKLSFGLSFSTQRNKLEQKTFNDLTFNNS